MNEKRDENFYNSCSQTDFTYRYWVIIVYATKEEKYEFVPHEKCKFLMLYRRCASYVFSLCFVDEPLKTCDEKIKNEIYLPRAEVLTSMRCRYFFNSLFQKRSELCLGQCIWKGLIYRGSWNLKPTKLTVYFL